MIASTVASLAGGVGANARGDWYISVGRVIVAEPGRESAFPIVAGPASALPVGSAVRIIGLSPYCELVGATQIAQGAWSVATEELGRLRIKVPQMDNVRMGVRLALIDSGGVELARAQSTLVIAPASELAPEDATAAGRAGENGEPVAATDDAATGGFNGPSRQVQPPRFAPAPRGDKAPTQPGEEAARPPAAAVQPSAQEAAEPSTPAAQAISAEDLQAALAQMQRGNGFVARGDYATARLFFRKAAELGHAPGATALAKTFDPVELRRLGVVGFTGNEAEANKWYERARELGAASR